MSKPISLEQYKGRLTPAQAAKGIQVAIENAKALLVDARLLLEHERWARASSLAILSIEEFGKVPIIRGLLLVRDSKELRKEWRRYRQHTSKNVAWILPSLVASGARKLDELRPIFDDTSNHPRMLDLVKQIGFYSDTSRNCYWSSPQDIFDEELASTMVGIAETLVTSSSGAMTTEAELEIWVKHLRPVWRQDMSGMKEALVAAYREAKDEGLLEHDATVEDMATFVGLQRKHVNP